MATRPPLAGAFFEDVDFIEAAPAPMTKQEQARAEARVAMQAEAEKLHEERRLMEEFRKTGTNRRLEQQAKDRYQRNKAIRAQVLEMIALGAATLERLASEDETEKMKTLLAGAPEPEVEPEPEPEPVEEEEELAFVKMGASMLYAEGKTFQDFMDGEEGRLGVVMAEPDEDGEVKLKWSDGDGDERESDWIKVEELVDPSAIAAERVRLEEERWEAEIAAAKALEPEPEPEPEPEEEPLPEVEVDIDMSEKKDASRVLTTEANDRAAHVTELEDAFLVLKAKREDAVGGGDLSEGARAMATRVAELETLGNRLHFKLEIAELATEQFSGALALAATAKPPQKFSKANFGQAQAQTLNDSLADSYGDVMTRAYQLIQELKNAEIAGEARLVQQEAEYGAWSRTPIRDISCCCHPLTGVPCLRPGLRRVQTGPPDCRSVDHTESPDQAESADHGRRVNPGAGPAALLGRPPGRELAAVRHCICLVFPLPSWLRQCLSLRSSGMTRRSSCCSASACVTPGPSGLPRLPGRSSHTSRCGTSQHGLSSKI